MKKTVFCAKPPARLHFSVDAPTERLTFVRLSYIHIYIYIYVRILKISCMRRENKQTKKVIKKVTEFSNKYPLDGIFSPSFH